MAERNHLRFPLPSLLFAAVALCGARAGAAVPATVEFNRDVRPILSDKCFACHGIDAKHRKADLRLDLAASATADHKGVRAVVPGDVGKSALWAKVNATVPPKDSPTITARRPAGATVSITCLRSPASSSCVRASSRNE